MKLKKHNVKALSASILVREILRIFLTFLIYVQLTEKLVQTNLLALFMYNISLQRAKVQEKTLKQLIVDAPVIVRRLLRWGAKFDRNFLNR
ncbi:MULTISPECIES: hypothetical protein [unclassified Paenibacillus]|uniref:hypothetical protein n=1 Tax=unclassified Paenibacillus TaxID=185978 RepID=UPI0036374061